jgi:hypothetical protein
MPTYRIGQVFGNAPHPEGGEFNYHGIAGEEGGAADLVLRFSRPSVAEIDAVRRGECEFAVVEQGGVTLFLYRFGKAIQWSDAPFDWHRLPEARRVPPPAEGSEQQRQLLNVFLVDADHATIQAMRTISLSPAVTLALWGAIRRQISAGSLPDGDTRLAAVYAAYPRTESLLTLARARGKGGE